MADREYKIQLRIEGDASGSAPVDAGLKRVEEGAKRAEQALERVEEQSKQTERAVSRGASPGAQFGVGQNGLPLPDKVRSWHTPEEAAAIERAGAAMRSTAAEAGAMEAATARAGTAMGTLGTAAVAVGSTLTLVGGTVLFGARKEIGELGSALGDLGSRFARAASEAVGLPQGIKEVTNAVKEYSGAAAEEAAAEAKVRNAKLDAALARQGQAQAAQKEREAIAEVTDSLREENQELENKLRRLREIARTEGEVESVGFANERARLANTPGLSREERARRETDIDRREEEARQTRQRADLQRQRGDELKRLEVAQNALDAAQAGGDPKAIAKAAVNEDAVRNQVSGALISIDEALKRLERTGPVRLDTINQQGEVAISSAAGQDQAEKQRLEDADRQARLRELREQVLGGTGGLRGAIEARPNVPGGEDALKLITGVERAARELEQGGATGREMEAFQQAMQRLAAVLQKLSPSLSAGLRTLRAELDQRLLKIEEDIGALNAGSTK